MVELFFIVLLIIANGVFSGAEAAVVASRKARLQQRADSGDHRAAVALELAEDPDTFLSTVQVGITLVGIFTGAFGGATLSKGISASIRTSVPALAPYADTIGLVIVVAAITYFSLILGELVPKRLALGNPENIAARVAGPMRTLSRIASPVVWFLSFSTSLVLRVLGIKASDEPAVTEEEIKVMLEQGAQAGVFHETESTVVDRVFALGDRDVANLMTRRPEVVWLDSTKSWTENAGTLAAAPYSRLPVGEGTLDRVVGVVRAKDLLSQTALGEMPDIVKVMEKPFFVPESMPAFRFLEELRRQRTHIAIVVDEFGGTQGVVTLHDILEALVGDLPVVDDSDEGYAVQRDDGSWFCDGLMPLHEFKKLFHIAELPDRAEEQAESLSGFILLELGRIPQVAEHFESIGLYFEIVDMDGQRIDKILVRPVDVELEPGLPM
jgi:putative hemolysin